MNYMYTLGAVENPKDPRDVNIAQVQAPVAIPEKYETDISWIPVFNQLANGSCVGHAHAVIHIYNEFKENKTIPPVSPRYLYALSKKYDGYDGQGTYPRVTAKIQVDKGCASEIYVKNDNTLSHEDYIKVEEKDYDNAKYKMKGYAFVPDNLEALKQAIYLNGLVAITISVGNYDNPIKKGQLGLHRVVAYGYDGNKILYRNSWGEAWGDKGNGYFEYQDQSLLDSMTFVDMPNEVLEENKKKGKIFKKGDYGVSQLQRDLKALGYFKYPVITGYFGSVTESAVKAFQRANSLYVDGIAGPITLQKIEELKKKPDFGLDPKVEALAYLLIAKCKQLYGYNIRITEGYRTQDRQDYLYASGRTRPGPILTKAKKSKHTERIAFDICFVGNDPYPKDDKKWKAIADVGVSIGLTAGYYFKGIKDSVHFEI